jgi:hypothetical protein
MSLKQEFKYITAENQTFLEFPEWIRTLPDEEQEKFARVMKRQLAHRQKLIDANKLRLDQNGDYIWDDSHVENKQSHEYKPYDPTWLKFWNRYMAYLEENNVKFEINNIKL